MPQRLVDGDAKPRELSWLSHAVVVVISYWRHRWWRRGKRNTWASQFVLESCRGQTYRSLGSIVERDRRESMC